MDIQYCLCNILRIYDAVLYDHMKDKCLVFSQITRSTLADGKRKRKTHTIAKFVNATAENENKIHEKRLKKSLTYIFHHFLFILFILHMDAHSIYKNKCRALSIHCVTYYNKYIANLVCKNHLHSYRDDMILLKWLRSSFDSFFLPFTLWLQWINYMKISVIQVPSSAQAPADTHTRSWL